MRRTTGHPGRKRSVSAEAEHPPQRGGRINFNTVLAGGLRAVLHLSVRRHPERGRAAAGAVRACSRRARPRLLSAAGGDLLPAGGPLVPARELQPQRRQRLPRAQARQLCQHRLHHADVRGLRRDPAAARLRPVERAHRRRAQLLLRRAPLAQHRSSSRSACRPSSMWCSAACSRSPCPNCRISKPCSTPSSTASSCCCASTRC